MKKFPLTRTGWYVQLKKVLWKLNVAVRLLRKKQGGCIMFLLVSPISSWRNTHFWALTIANFKWVRRLSERKIIELAETPKNLSSSIYIIFKSLLNGNGIKISGAVSSDKVNDNIQCRRCAPQLKPPSASLCFSFCAPLNLWWQ